MPKENRMRKNNSQETIQRILDAAIGLFKEKGFDKTSMQDIVVASQMSKGAIFHHFRSKEEVFETAMAQEYAFTRDLFDAFLGQLTGMTAKEKMQRLLVANFEGEEEPMTADAQELIDMAASSPHLMLADMRRNISDIAPIVTRLIDEGIGDGSISTAYPQELGEVFILLYNHWANTHPFDADVETLRRRVKFLQYMMGSLGCDIVTDQIVEYNIAAMEKYKQAQEGATSQ